MSPILEVKDLTRNFGGLAAVSNVNITLEEGELIGLIGPNGAGKTPLFNMIAGAMPCDGGTITFAGERIDGLRSDQ
ncbi:MAG: ATP-binding cassette domain-containing protein, partial [Propionibacteriaceae bacterium]|nr:ATP-binding cassette domain-containing protein [Propionibacteriaceae bacterium]